MEGNFKDCLRKLQKRAVKLFNLRQWPSVWTTADMSSKSKDNIRKHVVCAICKCILAQDGLQQYLELITERGHSPLELPRDFILSVCVFVCFLRSQRMEVRNQNCLLLEVNETSFFLRNPHSRSATILEFLPIAVRQCAQEKNFAGFCLMLDVPEFLDIAHIGKPFRWAWVYVQCWS